MSFFALEAEVVVISTVLPSLVRRVLFNPLSNIKSLIVLSTDLVSTCFMTVFVMISFFSGLGWAAGGAFVSPENLSATNAMRSIAGITAISATIGSFFILFLFYKTYGQVFCLPVFFAAVFFRCRFSCCGFFCRTCFF